MGVGVDNLPSRGIEERFLDFADRLLRRSEGGRKNRSAPLENDCFERDLKDCAVFERLNGVGSLGGVV